MEFNKGGGGGGGGQKCVPHLYYLNEPMKCDINEARQRQKKQLNPWTTHSKKSCLELDLNQGHSTLPTELPVHLVLVVHIVSSSVVNCHFSCYVLCG